jgi:hypothetical protein
VDKEVQGGVQMTNFSNAMMSCKISNLESVIGLLRSLDIESDYDFELMRRAFFALSDKWSLTEKVPRDFMLEMSLYQSSTTYCIVGYLYLTTNKADVIRPHRRDIVDRMIQYFTEQLDQLLK